MAEAKRYRLLELPWRDPERRFALVVPSARRPGDYEVGEGFPSPEEAELRCAAEGIDIDFRNDVEVERLADRASKEYLREWKRVRDENRRRRRRA